MCVCLSVCWFGSGGWWWWWCWWWRNKRQADVRSRRVGWGVGGGQGVESGGEARASVRRHTAKQNVWRECVPLLTTYLVHTAVSSTHPPAPPLPLPPAQSHGARHTDTHPRLRHAEPSQRGEAPGRPSTSHTPGAGTGWFFFWFFFLTG